MDDYGHDPTRGNCSPLFARLYRLNLTGDISDVLGPNHELTGELAAPATSTVPSSSVLTKKLGNGEAQERPARRRGNSTFGEHFPQTRVAQRIDFPCEFF